MKCSQVRKMSVAYREDELPPPLVEHFEHCSACRTFYERSEGIQRLLSLKRHELRDAGRAEQCRRDIHQVLVEEEYRREQETEHGWEGATLPALRYALAAVMIALIGVNILMVPELPLVQSSLPAPIKERAAEPVMRLAATNLPVDMGLPAIMRASAAPSNREPSGVHYGTRPSALVGYTQ